MNEYVKAIESRMSDDSKDMLKKIYAPEVVAVPLSDSRKDVCVLADGEIRSYGKMYLTNYFHNADCGGKFAYLSSVDGGISWTKHYAKGTMHSCTYIPEKDFYINCVADKTEDNCCTYIQISKTGPDDPSPRKIKISDHVYTCMFLPQKSAFTDRIWITAERKKTEEDVVPAFIYSDDFGESWTITELPMPPRHEVVYPHKDIRWTLGNGTEPHVAELSENKMMMIIRNATDFFYQSFSCDGGTTWSEPEPSVFHGTDTTAYLLRLSDGRCVCFWNNTQPISEPRHDKQLPDMGQWTIDGYGEDAFTNRDINHAAITEDGGENWIGFREMYLNDIRNASDFRYTGNRFTSNDKSIHQFQAFELPFGKILVSMGQNDSSRKLVIFDINWLYETARTEDFMNGLKNVSTHVYLKSISGCTARFGNGHCAWNRTHGAVMMPDPDGGYLETVLISKHHDDRLFNDIQGVVWNFPSSKKGEVCAEIKLVEKRVRISLADHWFNPCDEHTGLQSQFSFELDLDDIGAEFTTIRITYDTDERIATVCSGEKKLFKIRMSHPAPVGLSYISLQCATDGDSKGVYLKKLTKE